MLVCPVLGNIQQEHVYRLQLGFYMNSAVIDQSVPTLRYSNGYNFVSIEWYRSETVCLS